MLNPTKATSIEEGSGTASNSMTDQRALSARTSFHSPAKPRGQSGQRAQPHPPRAE